MKSLKNYGPLIILVLLIDTIAELIGMQVFKIGKVEVSILPLVFAVILAIIVYLLPLKPIKRDCKIVCVRMNDSLNLFL